MPMLKTCTTLRSVRLHHLSVTIRLIALVAKKEDDPEQALKEFRAIVDKEEEKGDWCVDFVFQVAGLIVNLAKGFQSSQAVNETAFPGGQTSSRSVRDVHAIVDLH